METITIENNKYKLGYGILLKTFAAKYLLENLNLESIKTKKRTIEFTLERQQNGHTIILIAILKDNVTKKEELKKEIIWITYDKIKASSNNIKTMNFNLNVVERLSQFINVFKELVIEYDKFYDNNHEYVTILKDTLVRNQTNLLTEFEQRINYLI